MLSVLLVILRAILIVISILSFLFPVLIRRIFLGIDVAHAMRWSQRWARLVLPILGIHIETKGKPHSKAALYMSNHRSYFDPLACMPTLQMTPISKAEVRKWPFFGFVGRSIGVIFVERDNKQSRKNTLQAIKDGIKQHNSIMLYPEGTTSDAKQSQEFKPGGFRLAAENNIPIVPVAIDYRDPKDAWINNDTFVRHFVQFLGKLKVSIKVSYGEVLISDNAEELMNETKKFIDKELKLMNSDWKRQQYN